MGMGREQRPSSGARSKRRDGTLEDHKTHLCNADERETVIGTRTHCNKRTDILEDHKNPSHDSDGRDKTVSRVTHCNIRSADFLASSRPNPCDHSGVHSKQTSKGSNISIRFKSLEEKDGPECARHCATTDIRVDGRSCHRRCGCSEAALDRRYFDQPFACIHCHGSAIEPLEDYFEWNSITEVFVPPGDAYNEIFLDAGIDTRVILRSGTGSLNKIHQSNKSLAGNFRLSDLYLDKRKCVRFDSRKASDLTDCTWESKSADYCTFGLIISRDLFRGQVIPADIMKWICLMEEDPHKEYLIVHNICLMEWRQSVTHFGSLYAHLEILRKEKSGIYWLIIKELTARHPLWKEESGQNFYVEAHSTYKDPKTGDCANYENDARGLLRLVWNLSKNVLPDSVVFIPDPKARKGQKFRRLVAAREFTDRMIESMIKSTFIGLMVDLQELLHKWGHLERFYIEEWMGKA